MFSRNRNTRYVQKIYLIFVKGEQGERKFIGIPISRRIYEGLNWKVGGDSTHISVVNDQLCKRKTAAEYVRF